MKCDFNELNPVESGIELLWANQWSNKVAITSIEQ